MSVDTLKYSKKLTDAGQSPEIAKIHADAVYEGMQWLGRNQTSYETAMKILIPLVITCFGISLVLLGKSFS